jgi:hypothetical protein
MLIRTLLVTLLFGVFYLQQAMAEETPPPAAAEPVPAASIPAAPPAAVPTPDAPPVPPAPPAAFPVPDEPVPPAPPAAIPAPEVSMPPAPPADMPSETTEQEMEQRIKAYRELYDARKLETLKQLEDARRRYEARQRAYAEKVENYLKQREERLAEIAKQYDEKRQSIVSERDYLVDHNKELLQMAIDSKEAMIKRQEDLRNEAEERKARLAAFLSAMEDMTPQERYNYINAHRQEIFERPDEFSSAYPGGPQVRPSYGENPYSRLPAAPQ